MSADTLKRLFVDELRDVYDAEYRIRKAMPNMIAAARGVDLVGAFEAHLEQSREQVARLEEVFDLFRPVTPAQAVQGDRRTARRQ